MAHALRRDRTRVAAAAFAAFAVHHQRHGCPVQRNARDPRRKAQLVVRSFAEVALQDGDALLIQDEKELTFSEGKNAEVLVFDLAP